MTPPGELALFGVDGGADADEVEAALREGSEDVDAIFLDHPAYEGYPWRDFGRTAAQIPVQFVGWLLALLLLALLRVLTRGTLADPHALAVRRVETAADATVHAVGEQQPTPAVPGYAAIALNWAALALLAWIAPVALAVAAVVAAPAVGLLPAVRSRGHGSVAVLLVLLGAGAVGALTWTGLVPPWLLIGLVVAGLVAGVQAPDGSEEAVLDRVAERSHDPDVDRGVLLTGREGLRGLAVAARDRGIDVPWVGVIDRDGVERRERVDPTELPTYVVGAVRRAQLPGVVAGSERGALSRRVGAALADLSLAAFVGLVALFCWVVLLALSSIAGLPVESSPTRTWRYVGVTGLLLYYVPLEYFWGTTPGKHAFGLAVADASERDDGQRAVLGPLDGVQVLARNLLRPLDLLGGAVAVLLTGRRQRLGDLVAGTVVGTIHHEGPDDGAPVTDAEIEAHDALGFRSAVDAHDGTDHAWRAHVGLPASPRVSHEDRARAAGLDLLAAFMASICGAALLAVLVGTLEAARSSLAVVPLGSQRLWFAAFAVVMAVWPVAYFVVLEYRYGTTIGKWHYGLVVATEDGDQPSLGQLLVRNALRPLDVVGGALLVLVTDSRQRLGDLAAGTVVRRCVLDESAAAPAVAGEGAVPAERETPAPEPRTTSAGSRDGQES